MDKKTLLKRIAAGMTAAAITAMLAVPTDTSSAIWWIGIIMAVLMAGIAFLTIILVRKRVRDR